MKLSLVTLKTYTISEQQVNPIVVTPQFLSLLWKFQMANIVNRQMPVPQELPQQIPTPWAKVWLQKFQGGGTFLVQILGGVRGMVMAKIDSCIKFELFIQAQPRFCFHLATSKSKVASAWRHTGWS